MLSPQLNRQYRQIFSKYKKKTVGQRLLGMCVNLHFLEERR